MNVFRKFIITMMVICCCVITTGCDFETSTTEINNQKDQQILDSINYLLGTDWPQKNLIIRSVTYNVTLQVQNNEKVIIYKVQNLEPTDVVFFVYNNGTCFKIADFAVEDTADGAYFYDQNTAILQLTEQENDIEGIWYADYNNQYIVKLK